MPSSKQMAAITTLWFLVVGLSFLLLWDANVARLRAIAREPASVDGLVTSTECPNHATVRYTYSVGGQSYRGQQSLGNLCEHLNPGDKITVYYSKSSPQLS